MGMDPEPTRLGPRFDAAVQYALIVHSGQERKGSRVPYVSHLLGTTGIVLQFGGSEDQAMAAMLHDAAEDQGGKERLDDIRVRFGERVAHMVEGCTDTLVNPKPEWEPRKLAYIKRVATEDADTRLVSAADKLDNVRAITADLREVGADLWKRFKGGEKTLWYYRALVEAYERAEKSALVRELAIAVRDMERLAAEKGTGRPG